MNWKTIIAELKLCGLNQEQIAAECGCAQSTISDVGSGKIQRPNFDIGTRLTALHKKHKRKLQTIAPAAGQES